MTSSMHPGHLLVRADANSTIGAGHVMRCLAIAQAWREEGGTVTFAMARGGEPLHRRLIEEGVAIEVLPCEPGGEDDCRFTSELASPSRAIIVDGYHFAPEYRGGLISDRRKLVIVDDCGDLGPYRSDLVVNPSWLGQEPLYDPAVHALVGNRYALLRREFRDHTPRVVRDDARDVLVTLGGADPGGVTPSVLRALDRVDAPLRVTVVVGGTNQGAQDLVALAASSRHEIEFAHNVTHMGDLMVETDLAISAGGGTCWELAHLGVPTVVVIVADNQIGVAGGLERHGVVTNLGRHEDLDTATLGRTVQDLLGDFQRRSDMSQRGRELIDGRGPLRVVEEILAS